MIKERTMYHCEMVERVNAILAHSESVNLLNDILNLVVQVAEAQAGTLYFYDTTYRELILKTSVGNIINQDLIGTRIASQHNVAILAISQKYPISSLHASSDSQEHKPLIPTIAKEPIKTFYCIPLIMGNQHIGIIETFNTYPTVMQDEEQLEILHLLSLIIAPHISRMRQLTNFQRRENRLLELIDIMSRLSTTLERERLLDDIMVYAQEFLDVEATSIWLKDEESGDLILHVATGEGRERLREVRVPAGHGIIGNVTSSGETIVVNDVDQDSHFYSAIDKQSGFTTRAILCVPLQAPSINLGSERGELKETIIGGAQALNKRDGKPFSTEDVQLFELLAGQAATILQFSELYNELARLYNELAHLFNKTQRLSEQNYKMFWGIIKGITSFIDRKDPYTRGHSIRVADFSVAIARQLKLPRDMIEHIHIGGILHDVGKIGVPDAVLKKPSHLTDEEMSEIKLHPIHGMDLLEESDLLWLLPIESQAVKEHHERLDGTGYPKGLKGRREEHENDENHTENGQEVPQQEGISLIGRIVAVADAFDAMTSDRPYRPGMSAQKALHILQEAAGTEFDPVCVEALIQAREMGGILIQRERDEEHQPFMAITTSTDRLAT